MIKGYTSKQAIEEYMLLTIDESMDERIDRWIEAVENYIDAETNNDFAVAEDESGPEEERVYDGDGTSTLFIDPAMEISSVSINDGEPLDESSYVLYPANRYPKDKIALKSCRKFLKGLQNITVTGRFGYDAVPADIEFVATVLVAGIINFSNQSEGEIQSMTIGRYSVSYKDKKQIGDFETVQATLIQRRRYK